MPVRRICSALLILLISVLTIFSMIGIGEASGNLIHTAAGGGPNNIPAISANISSSSGVAVDPHGNIYISANIQNRVFRVNVSGNLTVLAGTGTPGWGGDGGPAVGAQLNSPVSVATDAAGNVYIADQANHVIRAINTGNSPVTMANVTIQPGDIATVAGTGNAGYNQDGIVATLAQLNSPSGVALDSTGNLYIADQGNARIRKVDAGTGKISTVAGTGAAGYNQDGIAATLAQLNNPSGVALDSTGNVYIADQSNRIIRAVNTQGSAVTVASVLIEPGNIATVAGNGTIGYSADGYSAVSSSLYRPSSVVADVTGNLYIADTGNSRIRVVNESTTNTLTLAGATIAPGAIATLAGTGTARYNQDGIAASGAQLNIPAGVAEDTSGNIYIADTGNSRIRVVNPSSTNSITVAGVVIGPGDIATIAGTGTAGYNQDGIAATSAKLNGPTGVAVDTSGNIYVADTGNSRIRVVNRSSPNSITVVGVVIGPGDIATIAGTGTAGYNQDGIAATSSELNGPGGVALDIFGTIYLVDTKNQHFL